MVFMQNSTVGFSSFFPKIFLQSGINLLRGKENSEGNEPAPFSFSIMVVSMQIS